MSLLNSLKDLLGEGAVSVSKADLLTYSRDNLPLTIFHQRQKKTPIFLMQIVWAE